jgi:hypothetical protein
MSEEEKESKQWKVDALYSCGRHVLHKHAPTQWYTRRSAISNISISILSPLSLPKQTASGAVLALHCIIRIPRARRCGRATAPQAHLQTCRDQCARHLSPQMAPQAAGPECHQCHRAAPHRPEALLGRTIDLRCQRRRAMSRDQMVLSV